MNSQANMSLLRSFLTVVGGLLAGYGLGTADQWSHVIGDIMVIVPAVISAGTMLWSFYAHFRMVKVPEQTIVQPLDTGPPLPAKAAVKEGLLT